MPRPLTPSKLPAVRNEKLYSAVRSYVAAVIELARSATYSQRIPNPVVQGTFSFFHLANEIHPLPEFEACREEILDDNVVAAQLKVLTGRPGIVQQSADAEGLMRQLPMLGISGDRLEFDETRFELEYSNFEDSFYGETLEYEVIAPLSGISFERDVEICDGIEIILIDETGTKVDTEKAGQRKSAYPGYGWAIRTTYSLPKLVGISDNSPEAVSLVNETRQVANDSIDRVITILRLLQASHAAAVQKVHRTRSWVFQDSGHLHSPFSLTRSLHSIPARASQMPSYGCGTYWQSQTSFRKNI